MLKSITLNAPKPKKLSEVVKLRRAWPAFVDWKRANPDVLALPMPPNMANGRGHWRTKDAARKEYFQQCTALLNANLISSPAALWGAVPPDCVEVAATLFLIRTMDFDGATSRIKFPLDWLVRNGYLIDDGPVNCELLMPKQAKASKTTGPPRIKFVLKPFK